MSNQNYSYDRYETSDYDYLYIFLIIEKVVISILQPVHFFQEGPVGSLMLRMVSKEGNVDDSKDSE